MPILCDACNGTGQIKDYGEGTVCAGCDGMGYYTPIVEPPPGSVEVSGIVGNL